MRIQAWTLAVAPSKNKPWAEVHTTYADALASVVRHFKPMLDHLSDAAQKNEQYVAAALLAVADFAIELTIIETEES